MFQFYTARWDPSTRLLSGQNGELVALSGQNVAVCNVEVNKAHGLMVDSSSENSLKDVEG